MLGIVGSYHCIQFQWKLMNQTWEKGKKTNFGQDFSPFWPKFGPQKFLLWVLPFVDVRHCYKLSFYVISRKTNEPNMRQWQKT